MRGGASLAMEQSREMKILILDTNFLMIPYQQRVDIFREIDRIIVARYELIVPGGVISELQRIQEDGSGSDRIAAKVALELIKDRDRHIKRIESHGNVDEFILEFAVNNIDSVVCTNDKELKRRLRKFRVPVIYLRGKNRLELIT